MLSVTRDTPTPIVRNAGNHLLAELESIMGEEDVVVDHGSSRSGDAIQLETYMRRSPTGEELQRIRDRFTVREISPHFDEYDSSQTAAQCLLIVRAGGVGGDVEGAATDAERAEAVAEDINVIVGGTVEYVGHERTDGELRVDVATKVGLTGDELDMVVDQYPVRDTTLTLDTDRRVSERLILTVAGD